MSAGIRGLRGLLAAAGAAALLVGGAAGGEHAAAAPAAAPVGVPARAPAAATPGACTTPNGVTVVVDHAALGGGVVVRCIGDFTGDGAGALSAAGLNPAPVARWGLAFICRINGRPGPGEPLAIAGNEGYTERCIDTPPASAFWSYWHAPNGGSWTFSQQGAMARTVISGGFEGWRFALNGSASNPTPPAYTPSRTIEAPAPPPGPPPAAPPSAGGGAAGGAGGNAGGSSGSGVPAGPTGPGSPSPAAGSPEATPDASSQEPSASPSESPSQAEGQSAITTATSDPAAAQATTEGPAEGASVLPTILVLAVLLVGGTGAALWARTRRRSPP